jgi:dimethylaniline monooxygenase (N-oxide forming)
MRSLKVAVIGAGASGICAAKHLLSHGISVDIFEIGSKIGGMWVYENDNGRSPAYRSLRINTPRRITRFSDYPFDSSVGMFPSHYDMANYVKSYADHFGVSEHVRFRSEVVAVAPVPSADDSPGLWKLTLNDGTEGTYDAVIVATGHLNRPRDIPPIRESFAGRYLHSFSYREPTPFAGERVCIIGTGNSALDIASDICVVADRTTLVARSGVRIAPKLVFGRSLTDVMLPLSRLKLPRRLRDWVYNGLIYMVHGNITRFGFRPVEKRVHITSNPTVIQHIAYGRIDVKNEIQEIDGRRITFSDGTTGEFDSLIAATGYHIDLPLVSSIVPTTGDEIELYKRIVPPEQPGLYFMGLINSDTALNQLFERQIKWIIPFISGEAVLPSVREMKQDIESKRRWVAHTFVDTPRHKIEELQGPYFRELDLSLAEAIRRRRSLARGGAIAHLGRRGGEVRNRAASAR